LNKVNKEIINGDINNFKEFVKRLDVRVPDNTLYTIDKVVRDRLRKGRFGIDFSEYIGIENEEEHKMHFYHHEMLRLGKTSIEIPYIPISIQLKERLIKSPMLPQNRKKINPSLFKAIRNPKNTKRAKTIAKYGSCRKGNGTAKEEFTDWRMRKRATDRLREKLVDQAKEEIRKTIFLDMIDAYQNIEHVKNIQEKNMPTEEAVASKSPKFGGEEEKNIIEDANYKNFSDFCYKTRHAIYPNPMF